jgi:hypothetical protein
MNVWEWLLVGMAGWTALGIVGVITSLVRHERAKVRQGLRWLVGAVVIYIAVVIGVSIVQPQRVLSIGQDQCFDEMCFAVTGVDEVPQFYGKTGIRDGSRLVRVTIRVKNIGRAGTQSDDRVHAYLIDQQGGRWTTSNGVNGNKLTVPVPAGGSIVSEPVFKVGPHASGLRLVFTRGLWQPGALVIGDTDSLFHRRTVVDLRDGLKPEGPR